MTRTHVFLIRLGLTVSIFAALGYFVAYLWYPDFFFLTDGGWQGLRLLLGVDLVLGPLLTLIVYRAGKPGVRFDMTTIAVVQIACLTAGIWIVYLQRPLAIVYVDGSFYSVTAQSFTESGAPVPDLDGFPGSYPKWVSVSLPVDYDEQSEVRGEMLRAGRMLATVSERYVPFNIGDMDIAEAREVSEILDQDRDSKSLRPWLAANGGTIDDYRFFRFGARYVYSYLGFDSKHNHFVGLLRTPAPL